MRMMVACSLLLGLAGCEASTGGYPSLAPRPVEAAPVESVAAASGSDAVPAVAPDAATQARIDAAEASSLAADRDFQAALAGTREAVARRGAAGSETWVAAEQALSALEADRATGRSGLADLDGLTRELLQSGDRPRMGMAPPVEAAAARIQARNDAQSKTLETLEAALPGS